MQGCLWLVGCKVWHLAIGWCSRGRWSGVRNIPAVRAGYHRSSELVSFMRGGLWLVGCYVCYLAIGWRGWGRWLLSAVRAGYHRSSESVSFMQGCLWLVGCNVCHLAIVLRGRGRFENHCESLNACLWLVGFMAGEGGPGLRISMSTDCVRSRSISGKVSYVIRLERNWLGFLSPHLLMGSIQYTQWLFLLTMFLKPSMKKNIQLPFFAT